MTRAQHKTMNDTQQPNSTHQTPRIRRQAWLAATLTVVIIVADQIVKWAVKTHLPLYDQVEVTSWFRILFTENQGMAFGMQIVGTLFLALFRVAAIALFVTALVHAIRRGVPTGLVVCLTMVIAGAAGNIIDNAFYGLIYSESLPYDVPAQLVPFGQGYGSFLQGRVVDMFYFPLFTWPEWMPLVGGDTFFGAVFNLADASISCGAVALALFYFRYLTGQNGRTLLFGGKSK